MWQNYITADRIETAILALSEEREAARIIAGGTDLILELERHARKGIRTLVDVTRIAGLDQIRLDDNGVVHIGPLVTHNHCVASPLIRKTAFPLARACWEVGSPQIRNRGTVAGNLITASPANDTITPLMALGASVTLRSVRGERTIRLNEFYLGVRRTIMQPDEMLVDISFPMLKENQHGTYIKYALRRAQAISVVNAAVIVTIVDGVLQNPVITLGAVAPTIIHAQSAEAFLEGKALSDQVIENAANLVTKDISPIDDIRGSAAYRRSMGRLIVKRGLSAIQDGKEQEGFPEQPVLLWGENDATVKNSVKYAKHDEHAPIITRVNGMEYTFQEGQNKSLLRLLREEGKLIGSKEGCAEGECGACTMFLDGLAVMGCLVPAPRAHGAEIVTVEGLADGDQLHPVQQAFVEEGAVQCGYCTPGFLMSTAKLLEERPQPTLEEIQQSLTGNLCRCTGYYKIISAVEKAASLAGSPRS